MRVVGRQRRDRSGRRVVAQLGRVRQRGMIVVGMSWIIVVIMMTK